MLHLQNCILLVLLFAAPMSAHIHHPKPGMAEPVDYLNPDGDTYIRPDTVVYMIVLFTTGALLFLLVYFIITLSDLECDYLNAQQCCYRLNLWVLPKLCAHILAALVLLVSGHFWLAAMNVPTAVIWAREYWKIPTGNFGVFDPTEIHRMGKLKRHMRDVFVGVMFYLVAFFIYLYCFLTHLVSYNPLPKPPYEDDVGL
ncbi:Cornichon [Trinorchestia longiramus]|nr:Cornichon [Trinorchestia longiramus]